MAAIQSFLNIQLFKGTEKENLNEFYDNLKVAFKLQLYLITMGTDIFTFIKKEVRSPFSTNNKQQLEMTTTKQQQQRYIIDIEKIKESSYRSYLSTQARWHHLRKVLRIFSLSFRIRFESLPQPCRKSCRNSKTCNSCRRSCS